jgi:hypothetical protein
MLRYLLTFALLAWAFAPTGGLGCGSTPAAVQVPPIKRLYYHWGCSIDGVPTVLGLHTGRRGDWWDLLNGGVPGL